MADLHNGLPPRLDVDTLAGGAFRELLEHAFNKIAANILDVNTSEKAKRSVKIKIDAKPYPDRSGAVYTVSVDTTLAGTRPAEGTFFLARQGGEVAIFSRNHKQMEMDLQNAAVAPQPATPIRPS